MCEVYNKPFLTFYALARVKQSNGLTCPWFTKPCLCAIPFTDSKSLSWMCTAQEFVKRTSSSSSSSPNATQSQRHKINKARISRARLYKDLSSVSFHFILCISFGHFVFLLNDCLAPVLPVTHVNHHTCFFMAAIFALRTKPLTPSN